MDGTLIEPCIDFASMRRRIYAIASDHAGYPVDQGDVVTMVDTFPPPYQQQGMEVFDDIEAQALRDMKVMPGMLDLCRLLDERGMKRALLTRNVGRSADYLFDTFLFPHQIPRFSPQVARDTINPTTGTVLVAKPQPDGIQYICSVWNCDPSQIIMVGDSDKDDIVAGNRAGCGATILLKTGCDNDSGNAKESDEGERQPTLVIDLLATLQTLLEESNVVRMAR
jgi:phosphoglycolate phosphatase-like HAD superfamily hydrolase